MDPLVFDGVGTIFAINPDGTLKYVDQKVNKVTAQLQFNWQNVMGGDSGYAFHYVAQDLQDKISIEVPRYSPALAELSQGAQTTSGTTIFDENEEGILDATNGYTLKNGTNLVALSDSVYLKGTGGILTPLVRVASAPTATDYSIDVSGKITSATANNGKTIVVVYKWTKTNGTTTGFTGTRKPRPFKFIHRFLLRNDKDGSDVDCQFTIYKALGGGQTDVTQERKKANVMNISLEIMEPDLTADNPNLYAAELKFGI
ncbi:MAG: hypothetical protein JWM44_1325 [Bacilli bacterium]|nr:hypothetical protein [Bacilli bacterium]